MPNISPIAFLDVSLMTANLILRHKALTEKPEVHLTEEILKPWPSARSVLAKIKQVTARDGTPSKIGAAWLETLQPGEWIDWRVDPDEDHDRFHVCLVPSLGAFFFAGDARVEMAVGWLNWINHRVLHSAVNLGSNPRCHLVVDIKKPVIG